MDSIGAFFDEEWESSFSSIFSSLENGNSEYGSNYINNGITSANFLPSDGTNVNIMSEIESCNLYSFANSFPNIFHHFSEENCNNSGSNSPFFQTQSYENNYFFNESNRIKVSNNNIHGYSNIPSHDLLVSKLSCDAMDEPPLIKPDMGSEYSGNGYNQSSNIADLCEELKLERKIDTQDGEASGNEEKSDFHGPPKKKPRLPRDAQREKRNALPKKNKKISMNDTEEQNNGTIDTQNHPSFCSSEDGNSNIASPYLNSSEKTRAKRGAATDPQSLYARRRRERINERLRTLQNLVPNGTKVDISTMLEEAVHYVKFLQLQIKLLSSDEMWMFAPIAYNGMDMGLYNKIFT